MRERQTKRKGASKLSHVHHSAMSDERAPDERREERFKSGGSPDRIRFLTHDLIPVMTRLGLSRMTMTLTGRCIHTFSWCPASVHDVFHTTWRREYGIRHVIWCCGQASQVQLLHSSSPASLSHFKYSVPAVFLRVFSYGVSQVFPLGIGCSPACGLLQ